MSLNVQTAEAITLKFIHKRYIVVEAFIMVTDIPYPTTQIRMKRMNASLSDEVRFLKKEVHSLQEERDFLRRTLEAITGKGRLYFKD